MTLPRAQSRGQIKCLSSTGAFADLFPRPSLTYPLPFISLASTSFGASSFMGHTFIYTYIRFLLWKASLVLVTVWPFFQLELCRKQATGCLLSMQSLIQRLAPLMKRAGKPPSVVSWNIRAVVPGTDLESTRGPQHVWLWQRWLSKDLLEAVSSSHTCDCLEGEAASSALQISLSWARPSLLTLTHSSTGKGILGNVVPVSPQKCRGDIRKRGPEMPRWQKQHSAATTPPPSRSDHLALHLRRRQPLLCILKRFGVVGQKC